VGYECGGRKSPCPASAGHGRVELRETWLRTDPECLEARERAAWRDLRSVAQVRGTRTTDGQVSVQ